MSFKKKISAIAAAAVTALSLTSCGKNATWGARIDGTEIRAGIFIMFQSDAVYEAQSYMTEDDKSVFDITIEDKPARDWINDEITENMREYAAVEHKFDELGLSFEESETKALSGSVDQWWDEYIGEYYEELGVSRQSYYDVALNSQKRNKIFEYYYGAGGEKEVPEQDIKDYLTESNARIKYIEMPLKDGEGNLLKSAGKAEIKEMAEGYIERMKGGEDFETIKAEYIDYYNGLIDTAVEAGETGGEANKLTYADSGTGSVITAESTVPSEKAVETAFTLGAEDYALVEENEVYYLVYRMDLFADETYLDNQRDTVLQTLKGDEFDETVKSWLEGQSVELNDAAFKKYKPEKHIAES